MDFRGALHPNYCSYGFIISQPLIAEVEVEDSQAQAEKPAARGIDSLVKAAVPSRCSKKEIEQPPLKKGDAHTLLLSIEDILKARIL